MEIRLDWSPWGIVLALKIDEDLALHSKGNDHASSLPVFGSFSNLQ